MTVDEWIHKYDKPFAIFRDLYEGLQNEESVIDILIDMHNYGYDPEEVQKAAELITKVQLFTEVDADIAVENIYNYLFNKFHQMIA